MKTHGVAAASASIAAANRAGMARSEAMDHKLVPPAEIQWGPGPAVLPAGIQGAVLYGDPTKDGLFSMRFKLPKGYRVAPHTLSKAGLFTVISGTFRIGMGETDDPSKAKAMPAGSFIALAPGTPHFVAVDEETVVQLNNIGPWEITYIDPKDDPRQKPN
jgi:quercetin dioxygenase-like cupin family protein